MPSMINKLKENVLENSLQPPQQAMAQPMGQPTQPAAPAQSSHPQTRAIEGMQKRKGELERQYGQMSPESSMLQNAAASVMNAPNNESPMAILAKGLMGASQGLKQHGAERSENLRQQQEIDQSIANTYQFIKDYDYNRAITREKLDLEKRKVDIKEMEVVGKGLSRQAKLAQERTNNNQSLKGLEEQYNFLRSTHNQAGKLLAMKEKLNPWDALSSKMLGKGAAYLNNKMSDINIVAKEAMELLTRYLSSFKTGGRMSVYVAQLVEAGKPGVEMGYDAFFKLVEDIYKETNREMHRTEFTLDKSNQGIPTNIASRAYDISEQSGGVAQPNELVNYYLQNKRFPSEAELQKIKMLKDEQEKIKAQSEQQPEQMQTQGMASSPVSDYSSSKQPMTSSYKTLGAEEHEEGKPEDLTSQMKSDAQKAAERIFGRK